MDSLKIAKLIEAGWEVSTGDNFLNLSQSEVELVNGLERARALQKSRREFGVEGIHQFVSDVEGDWLETWEA